MTDFFNFNFIFPFEMPSWNFPAWSFQNFYTPMQFPTFNIFDNWFTQYNLTFPQNPQMPVFMDTFSYMGNLPKTETYTKLSTKQSSNTNTDTFTRQSQNTSQTDNLSLSEYNKSKGERLAKIALNRAVGWTGYCAAYVKSSIQAANLGSYKFGHAYAMKNILKNNKNFKEISPENVNVSELPAGCVLVYDKGTEGYSKKYGHTEITTGDGRAVSDGITKNLYKKPSSIFIPV